MSLSRALALKCGLAFAGCALAATLVIDRDAEPTAGIAAPVTRPKESARPKPSATAKNTASSAASLDIARLDRPAAADLEEDLFSLPKPPAPPPPPRARAPGPPPKPVAPPLPFRFLGTMVDGGTVTLFVARDHQNFSVKAGELVNEQYRLEQLNESLATFVYLPLGERQTMSIGSRN